MWLQLLVELATAHVGSFLAVSYVHSMPRYNQCNQYNRHPRAANPGDEERQPIEMPSIALPDQARRACPKYSNPAQDAAASPFDADCSPLRRAKCARQAAYHAQHTDQKHKPPARALARAHLSNAAADLAATMHPLRHLAALAALLQLLAAVGSAQPLSRTVIYVTSWSQVGLYIGRRLARGRRGLGLHASGTRGNCRGAAIPITNVAGRVRMCTRNRTAGQGAAVHWWLDSSQAPATHQLLGGPAMHVQAQRWQPAAAPTNSAHCGRAFELPIPCACTPTPATVPAKRLRNDSQGPAAPGS